jgi:diaphanous 1
MYQLSPDRKKYLLRQNSQSKSATLSRASGRPSPPVQSHSTGSFGSISAATRLVPQMTGDGGMLKRFSIAGWGAGAGATTSAATLSQISPPTSPEAKVEKFGTVSRSSKDTASEARPLQTQSTGGWSSWWTSSGGDKAAEKTNTAKSYVDGIRNARGMDTKLVKHLISLRVHLSTAQLLWIEEFVTDEGGLDALGEVLATLVGKGGKRKKLTEHEEMVLLEVVKCLRVLLNTEVRPPTSLASQLKALIPVT